MTDERSHPSAGDVHNPGGKDPRPQPNPENIDPPPGQDEIPEQGTTVGRHETAPEEIGESG
jgi:hypothetical protein